jgi:polyhydroxyalkanoate synthesis regulator protein
MSQESQLVTALNNINTTLTMLGEQLKEMNAKTRELNDYNKENREMFKNIMAKFMPFFEQYSKPPTMDAEMFNTAPDSNHEPDEPEICTFRSTTPVIYL